MFINYKHVVYAQYIQSCQLPALNVYATTYLYAYT